MGNVFAEQNNNKSQKTTNDSNEQMHKQQYTNLNLIEKLTKAASETLNQTPVSQMSVVKTPKEKCDDIADELNRLQEEVHKFNGQKYDKNFLKLDEFLTRCLLKLDEIDRSDENVNQQRKMLIDFTHQLAEHLDSKCKSSQGEVENITNELTNRNNSNSDANSSLTNEQ